MAEQWEVADWLMICTVLADVVSEDSEATAQGNREGLDWLNGLNGLSPGPGGQCFQKTMLVFFSQISA